MPKVTLKYTKPTFAKNLFFNISIDNRRTCKKKIGKTSIALKNEITCLTGWHCCVDFITAIWLLSKNQHTEK